MMSTEPGQKNPYRHWIVFGIFLFILIGAYAHYGFNIVKWRNSPDYGWRTMFNNGPNFVAETFPQAESVGLKVGDEIVSINGQPYSKFEELFFEIRESEPGSENTYTVVRDEQTLEITVVTGRLGLQTVLKRSGYLYTIGLIYCLIGILVYLMKPRAAESLMFLAMTIFIGLKISYAAPSDFLRPLWLYKVRLFVTAFIPAAMVHLALTFPKKIEFFSRRAFFWILPYAISFILFLLPAFYRYYWDYPAIYDYLTLAYLLLAILLFMVITVRNSLRDPSPVIARQSQLVFVGLFIGLLIPLMDLFFRSVLNLYLFPRPGLSYTIFLSAFPIAIGYTLVKHDLFAIDVIVRRTYGYVLSTATVIAAYGLIVSLLNITFQSADISRSPLFPIGFALGVVFTFRPLHTRIQNLVDRVFYRQHYDYRGTIKKISEALLSIFDPAQIQRTLLGAAVEEMFLENGVLLLRRAEGTAYSPEIVLEEKKDARRSYLSVKGDLVDAILDKRDALFRHEIEMNPKYDVKREQLLHSFDSFDSEMMMPLIYDEEVRGIISLGRKKSGKMFTAEDVDLLKTLVNQGAVALENARLFEENLEKGRMEEELKIAHDLQSSMLPETAPDITGFDVAALSTSAREVGGDFYDFIDIQSQGDSRQLGVIVGDVSGKAVSGALVMAAARSVFRVLSDNETSVSSTMKVANSRLNKDVKKGMFVALLYAVLDPLNKTLTFSNAGQTQPIILPDSQGESKFVDSEGDRFPLGILPECDYQQNTVHLSSGDTVFFYTDGVVEAMDAKEQMYGFDRLQEVISKQRGKDASSALKDLYSDVTDFVNDVEQHDDITLVVVKIL